MREIKFRGKARRDGQWFFGNYYDRDTKGHTHICNLNQGCLDIDPETVGQFTGLKDKNGKEIYEGDIFVRDSNMMASNSPYCVRYKHGSWIGVDANSGWLTLIEEADETYRDDLFYIEVIGNIHDNPELLTEDRSMMSIKEFIQHQAVSGCLTMEDRQHLELRDVERVIQMVREEHGYHREAGVKK